MVIVSLFGWGFYQDYNPFGNPPGEADSLNLDQTAQIIAAAVNEVRANAGLQAAPWDAKLASVAKAHTQDMIARNYYDHITPDGKDLPARTRDAGLACANPPYYLMAENLAISGPKYGYDTEDKISGNVVDAWMNSSEYRQNIMTASHDRIGVGASLNDDGQVYVALEFC